MLCSNCKSKEAVLHYKQIANGKKTELHLCADCANALGYTGHTDSMFDIGSILNDFISVPKMQAVNTVAKRCSKCSMSYDEFKRTGLLGCDKCYREFGSVIEASLSQIQPSTTHKGTLSGETGEKIRKKNEITELKESLKKAILDERYEDAASIRDKIKELEEKENG
jgi:protein arginine kinase activator